MPGAVISTALIVAGWAYFINANSMAAIWPMFGIANQMLAVIALAVVSAFLFNEGRGRYLWVTVLPMIVVLTTTSSAAVQMLAAQVTGVTTQLGNPANTRNWTLLINAAVQAVLIAAMLLSTLIVIIGAAARVLGVGRPQSRGFVPVIPTPESTGSVVGNKPGSGD
jgi:carbon starvation protein